MFRLSAPARLVAEPMEERILHSIDVSPLFGANLDTLHGQALSADDVATADRSEIAFVDAALPDLELLLRDLENQRLAGRPIEIVRIEAGADGLALIADTLRGRHDIGAVHLLTHGSDGRLQLGTSVLDAQTLMQRAGEVAGWSQALAPGADVLLYGCNLAETAAGQDVVNDLAALTGADVAASTDLTGAAALGGNWTLEYRTGAIQAALAPSIWEQTQWQGVMATYTVTTLTDAVGATLLPGSLRWAIAQANANPGTDTIVFAVNGTIYMAAGSSGGDDNKTGDYDLTDSVNIVGNGSANTAINGNGLDRVFDVRNAVTASFTGLTVQGGASNEGGGVRISTSASVTMQDVVVQNNTGSGSSKGGGIYSDGSLTLSQSIVQNNGSGTSGQVDGAGIYNYGTLVATDVEIRNNEAGTKDGGGVYVDNGAEMTLQNVTVANNHADRGGGIYNHANSTTLTNVTVVGNTASSQGAGLWADKFVGLNHVTVAYNTAPTGQGGGLYDKGLNAQVQNTLFAGNGGGNTNKALVSLGYNLSDDNSLGFLGVGDQRNVAAGAGFLASNGGFTSTLAIGASSAARDAANPSGAPATDQRGVATYGGRSDIGAYEYSPSGSPPTISAVANQTINEDQTLAAVGFTINDLETSPGSLLLSATSSNTALVPAANIVFGGSGANRTVGLTPAANANSNANGGPTTITVTVYDGDNSTSTSFVVTVLPQNDAPTGSVTISGTPAQGQTLTAANTLADADGLGAIGYQWLADGVAISGATGSTLVLGQAQVGKAISVAASYTDWGGTAERVTSALTAAVANVNDAPTGSVTISGTPTQGQTLTAANTLADIDGLGAITSQWKAAGVAIAGATGSTLLLAQAQVGKAITVSASYTDGHGSAESVSSAATAAVVNVNDAPTGAVTITGTPTQGQTLTVADTLADTDGLGAIGYQWKADGVAIAGATGNTLLLAQAQVGKAITVSASYTDGYGSAESVASAATAAVANVNDLPTGAITINGTATRLQTLTLTNTLADADGLGPISYQWAAGGVDIAGATGTSLLLDLPQVGTTITVRARYTDGFGTNESVTSAATAFVTAFNSAPTGSASISGTPTQGQTLTAANTLADTDGLGPITYQWLADGVVISGATGSTLMLGQAQVGKAISVAASYTDGGGTAESVTSAATAAVANVNDAPTGSVTISGTPTQGQTLTAANTLADIDGLGAIGYQWEADGLAISGATGSTLLLVPAQVGKAITVTASYTDGHGSAESVSSAATAAVVNVNDAPTGAVTITGTPIQGQTLTAANTLADADGLGAISYQWKADGLAISGATGSTLLLVQAQVGKAITVTAGYTDGYGSAESVTSAATAAVVDVNDAPTGTVTVTGTPTQGQTLTAANTLADTDGLGAITYQWKADGIAIAGATGSTLLLAQAQVGKAITVTASYTDGYGSAESVTSAATAAVANVNDAATGSVTISGTATQGQTLTAANTLADTDGLGAITYQWKADGVAIAGATGGTLLLAQAQVGKAITVTASYTDGYGGAESVTSAATAAVANVNDAPTGAITINGTATRLQTLTLTNTLADADGLGPISYQWAASGFDIAGATGTSLLLGLPQVWSTITVRARYTDGFGTNESVTSAATAFVTAFNSAPTGSVSISGTPTQGQTLTAANTLADTDGLGPITYQWLADGVVISGATGSALVLGQAQVGKAISVAARYIDGGFTAERVTSALTAAVANVNDAPTGSVTISGTPTQGQTLTAANTLADIDGLGAIGYQWKADGLAISGATGSTLLLVPAQVGKAITVTASYTDGYGSAESVSSDATAAVANVNDAPTGTVTVTGTPTQGQTLTAANTLADTDGLGAITYQWKADGIAIAGATGGTLLLAQAQVGKAITVTASYTDGYRSAESVTSAATAAVANVNDAPTGTVTITGTPTQGQTLTAANTLADADGLGAIAYQWFANGVAISGATDGSLLLAQAQVGQAITVTASYTDGYGSAESVTSAATAAVVNVNDPPTGTVTITGTPTQGQTLTAANTLADTDGLGAIGYQWKADGIAIADATGSTLVLGQAQVGQLISVAASYTDGYATSENVASAVTAAVANVNDAPTGSVTISGMPTQGQTLTVANTLADIDGLGAIGYQWKADGLAISGATGSTLLLVPAQVGKAITVTARYTDGYGSAESVSSAATAAVVNVNDAPTGTVTITGTPTQGQTLTVANTLADADGLGAIGYQWKADGVAIAGATGNSLLLAQAQVGRAITVAVSYTDGYGSAESVASAATTAVANVNDLPTGAVTITGTPTQGQTLKAADTLADADGLGAIGYQWKADGVAIAGATGNALLLAQAQVGRAITVTVSYTDGYGTAESLTSAATSAVANVNDAPTGSVTISGTPTQGKTLTAANSLADVDGLGVIAYQWKADGIAISGATGSTLLLAQAQVGKEISVTAGYTDGYVTAESVASAATTDVANINDAPTGGVTISGTPTQGQTLTAVNTLADADGLGAIGYQWKADGVAIAGATSNTLVLGQAQVGKPISVTASYADGYDTAESVSSAATTVVANVNDAPIGSVTISGTPTQGQTLTAANTLADADSLGAIGYQWMADGVAIAGATSSTLVLGQAQVGKAISVTASYADGYDTAESVASAATAAVANVTDAPTGGVTITGTPTQGQTLTAANTLTDDDGLGAITYQWKADGIAIGGATGGTLSLAQAQVGKAITVTASYTDGYGTSESVASAATAAVANVNDAPVHVQPLADRAVTAGSRLQFEVPQASFQDDDAGDVLSYRATLGDGSPLPAWLQFDVANRLFNADPTAADFGATQVQVTVTDAAGTTAQATFVINVAPAPPVAAAPAEPEATPVQARVPDATPVAAPSAGVVSAPSALPTEFVDLPAPPTAAGAATAPEEFRTAVVMPRSTLVADAPPSVVRQAERSEAALEAARVDSYQTLSATRLSQLLQSDELLRRLQELQRQMLEPAAERHAAVGSGIVLTSGVSIGYIVWLVRGGVLVSSMMSALPVWQMVDPMPVLTAAGAGRRSGKAAARDDQDLERLFERPDDRGRPARATPPTTPKPAPAAHGRTLPGAPTPTEPDR